MVRVILDWNCLPVGRLLRPCHGEVSFHDRGHPTVPFAQYCFDRAGAQHKCARNCESDIYPAAKRYVLSQMSAQMSQMRNLGLIYVLFRLLKLLVHPCRQELCLRGHNVTVLSFAERGETHMLQK